MTQTITNPSTGQVISVISETPELLVLESDYPAGCPSPPAHLHPNQDEHFEVLSGAVQAMVGNRAMILGQGDTLDIPKGTKHEFGGLPDQPGTVRWEIRPALRTREFLETVNRWADPATGRPSTLQAALTAKEYAPEFRLANPSHGTQRVLFAILAPLARMRGMTPN